MYCSNCGKQISDDVKFCPECGADIKTGIIPIKAKSVAPTPYQARSHTGRNIAIIVILVLALIMVPLTIFVFVPNATWGKYEESFDYYYTPASPSDLESIDLNLDIGEMIIKYNQTPTPYVAKIDVDFDIEGPFVAGKTYTDYFKPISWVNTSSPIRFTLESKPDAWIFPINWFSFHHIITVTVTLRTDVIYEIDAITTTGGVEMTVPSGVNLGNLQLISTTGGVSLSTAKNSIFQGNLTAQTTTGGVSILANGANFTENLYGHTTTGGLTMNFTNCVFGGNIVGDVTTGGIDFKIYNPEFTQASQWTLTSTTGGIDIEIYQYKPSGANITGQVTVTTGSIDVIYEDNQASVGGRFIGSTTTGGVDLINLGGFTQIGNEILVSDDYNTASYKYTFDLHTTTGGIEVDGRST